MKLAIPEFAMVVLIGTSGSGKSTFARKHFLPTEILSSDFLRGVVSDDENSQDHSRQAFEALHFLLAKRLEIGRLTVIDATNTQKEGRAKLLRIASDYHALKVAIVLRVPVGVCLERNADRPDRDFGSHVIRRQRTEMEQSLAGLRREGWHKIYVLDSNQIEEVEIVRERIWSRRPEWRGPFDIVGDVHGCFDELCELLTELGWVREPDWHHPEGRTLAFVGDLVDRGPNSVDTLKLGMDLVNQGKAVWVPGNHDVKLARALKGKDVTRSHGLAETLEQLESETDEFRLEVADFIENLVSHLVLDHGRLCLAHAGLRENMQGRGSKAVREFCLFGETTGEVDEFGLPVRLDWARNYEGKTMVVYGHTPVVSPAWLNNTLNIDSGCCFGGSLTALRYPELKLVSVRAHQTYAQPGRPIQFDSDTQPVVGEGELLDISVVTGRMMVQTTLAGRVTIPEENAIAALEVMSRFATDPKWLIHLPPTMSPCRTSERDGYLEYPTEAFDYYHQAGVRTVVCQEKHMGSRALAVVGQNAEAIRRRFRIETGESGVILTRTGRRFFEDLDTEQAIIQRLALSLERSQVFRDLESEWVLLDLELMPWSAKAIGLLRDQYAAVGASAVAHASSLLSAAESAKQLGVEGIAPLLNSALNKQESARLFQSAYRRYCWTVGSIEDYKLAPFHLLASEGQMHMDKPHTQHMDWLGRLCAEDPAILRPTNALVLDLEDEQATRKACLWWEGLVKAGGEGMVVKPMEFTALQDGKLVQPAIKVRGPEYLRIIYGPDYLDPKNLVRLRERGLNRKRSLATREYALGFEALQRFLTHKPLRSVHECVFGILALESQPVDPRL